MRCLFSIPLVFIFYLPQKHWMMISNEKCRDQTWCSVTLEVILLQAAKRTRRHLNDDPKKAPRKTKQEILPSFTDFSLVDLWRIDCTLGQTQLFIDFIVVQWLVDQILPLFNQHLPMVNKRRPFVHLENSTLLSFRSKDLETYLSWIQARY